MFSSPKNVNPRQKGIILFSCSFIIFKINSYFVEGGSKEEKIEKYILRVHFLHFNSAFTVGESGKHHRKKSYS